MTKPFDSIDRADLDHVIGGVGGGAIWDLGKRAVQKGVELGKQWLQKKLTPTPTA